MFREQVFGANDGGRCVEAQRHPSAEPVRYICLPVPVYVPFIDATAIAPAPAPASPWHRLFVHRSRHHPCVYHLFGTICVCITCSWTTRGIAHGTSYGNSCSRVTRVTACSSNTWVTIGADGTPTYPRETCRIRDVQQRVFFEVEIACWDGTPSRPPE